MSTVRGAGLALVAALATTALALKGGPEGYRNRHLGYCHLQTPHLD